MKVIKSFYSKILMIMLTLFLLFCGVSTVIWYRNFTREATNTAKENISTLITALTGNFEENIRDIDYITALISNKVRTNQNDSMIRYLTVDEKESALLVEMLKESQKYLSSRCSFKSYLNGLAVYNFNGRTCSYGMAAPFYEIASKDWFQEIKEGSKEVIYLAPHAYTETQPTPRGSQVFSIVRPVVDNGDIIGLVKADIKCTLLETLFDNRSMSGYELYVIDNDTEELIYSSEDAAEVSVKALSEKMTGSQGNYTETISKIPYLVVYSESFVTPWTVVGVVEQNKVISGFIEVRRQMLFMVGICMLLFIPLALLATGLATQDLRKLSAAVGTIDDKNLTLSVTIRSQDEVGTLYHQICAMTDRIRALIDDIRKKEAEKRNSEIQMLSLQINPHFLYNTLHTIKFLAVMQGVPNIEKVSNALSNMLHLNLDARKFISISEEQSYLKDYLSIQEYRYAGKFTYQIEVAEEVLDCMIPKLLCQPIVENALQHGIARSDEAGFVQIRISPEETHLRIAIKNSGKAFDQELLDGQHYRGKSSSHIGLSNIEHRLKLLFGEEGELKIFSNPELYTVVEVSLPIIRDKEVSQYDENYGGR